MQLDWLINKLNIEHQFELIHLTFPEQQHPDFRLNYLSENQYNDSDVSFSHKMGHVESNEISSEKLFHSMRNLFISDVQLLFLILTFANFHFPIIAQLVD